MASEIQPQLQLTDVYEIAENVGEQFQQLISQFGPTHLATVIPIVVGALEHLEYFVEDNQKLQLSNRKLMLKNDSLASEREQRLKLSNEMDELQYRLEVKKEDNKRLSSRVERLFTRNEDLSKQLERLQGTSLKSVPFGEDPLNSSPKPTVMERPITKRSNSQGDLFHHVSSVEVNGQDNLQLPRMSKRLTQVELELQKTRRKLVEAHHSLQSVTAENRAIKEQLEESRAEAALRGFENSRSEIEVQSSKTEPPKFYKQDLLAVLRERNELKEELDGLRDELYMAKVEIKQYQVQSYSHRRGSKSSRPRSSTRVREILDSISESVQVDPTKT